MSDRKNVTSQPSEPVACDKLGRTELSQCSDSMDNNITALTPDLCSLLFRVMSDSVYLIEPDTSRIIDANPAGYQVLGMERDELIDESVMTLNPDVSGMEQWREIAASIKAQGHYTFIGRHTRKDGSDFPVEVVTDYVEHDGTELMISVARDLSTHLRHSEYLNDSQLIRTLLLNDSSDGLWDWNTLDDSLFLSPQWFRMLGYGPYDVPQPTLETWSTAVHPDDRERVIGLLQEHLEGKNSRYEARYRLQARNGHYLWVHDRGMVAARDEHGKPTRMIGMVLDVTEAQRYADQLLQRSQRDELTGLYNRRTGYELFDCYLQESRENGQSLQVVMLDIDHFKNLNDEHGHLSGDRAIRHVTDTLQMHLREEDLLFRWGGEEFLLLCPGITREEATPLIQRLLAAVESTPFVTDGEVVLQMTCSAGMATFPQDGDTIRILVSAADKAMYKAKQAGRNRIA